METLVCTSQEILTETRNYPGWGGDGPSRKGVELLQDTIKNMGFGYTHVYFDPTIGWHIIFSMDKPKKEGDEYFLLRGKTLSGGGPRSRVRFSKGVASSTPYRRDADLRKLNQTTTQLDDWSLEEFSKFAGHAHGLARALD